MTFNEIEWNHENRYSGHDGDEDDNNIKAVSRTL